MRIAVIGTGYVGLVSGAGFADFGHRVTCVDIDPQRVASLQRGELPFHEPGLLELVTSNVREGRLDFAADTAVAVRDAAVVFLSIGTPSLPDGSVDLDQLRAAAEYVGRAITKFTVVVTKSTVPVGSSELVRATIANVSKHPFAVASNPEFLKEGNAVNDFFRPARVIVGVDDPRSLEVLREAYKGIMRTGDRMQVMDIPSAELTKYAANAMLALRISFMNELARLAEVVGADIELVRKGIGSDPRIGSKFLFPGIGFGGSCFGKDLRALRDIGERTSRRQGIVSAVLEANETQKRAFAEAVIDALEGAHSEKRVAVWGLAFKPETDDIREAPALALIARLREVGISVCAYDPIASANVRAVFGDTIEYATDCYAAARGADALVLVTEWHQLRQPDYARLRETMRGSLLFDGRNVWEPEEARRAGFTYRGVGRPLATSSSRAL